MTNVSWTFVPSNPLDYLTFVCQISARDGWCRAVKSDVIFHSGTHQISNLIQQQSLDQKCWVKDWFKNFWCNKIFKTNLFLYFGNEASMDRSVSWSVCLSVSIISFFKVIFIFEVIFIFKLVFIFEVVYIFEVVFIF